jgi:L-arabinonolactonase
MSVRLSELRLVVQTEDVIGEVPLWDAASARLSWIDIFKPALHVLDPATGGLESHTPPEKLGSYGLAGDGRYITAGRGGIAMWEPATGAFDRLSTPEADRPDNILNDGRVDLDGRFVVGSMDKMLAGPNGRLWQVEKGATRLLQDEDVMLPNSICWSPDGATFYFGDSRSNLIFAYDYDRSSGDISNRRVFADTSAMPGECDGSSVDAEGYLWNARFGGGCILRFAPDGSLDRKIDLPVTRIAHLAFGGPDLKTIYVTTARFRMKPEEIAAEPWAGGLLAMDSDVPGLPEAVYRS